jgi:hypothetical protein
VTECSWLVETKYQEQIHRTKSWILYLQLMTKFHFTNGYRMAEKKLAKLIKHLYQMLADHLRIAAFNVMTLYEMH